jgi:hypothetical protein
MARTTVKPTSTSRPNKLPTMLSMRFILFQLISAFMRGNDRVCGGLTVSVSRRRAERSERSGRLGAQVIRLLFEKLPAAQAEHKLAYNAQ